jgi:hypothetical protein
MIIWYQNYENASYEITQSTSIRWGGVSDVTIWYMAHYIYLRGGREGL